MRSPPHLGVAGVAYEPLVSNASDSITDGAKIFGVTRQPLNKVVNGKFGISPEIAIRLTKGFGSTEET